VQFPLPTAGAVAARQSTTCGRWRRRPSARSSVETWLSAARSWPAETAP